MDLLNALVALTNFVLIPAIAYGSQLALGALGVTLVYGILRFSNFAHGDTMAFGTMVAILVDLGAAGHGRVPRAAADGASRDPLRHPRLRGAAAATDRVVYRFYRAQRAVPVILVIVSMGVMFVYNGITRFIIGPGRPELCRRRALPHRARANSAN